jgi:glycosyltransferase involved in cell wall biosynthesis
MNNVCVLIPSYNEARTIGRIVREVTILGLSACVVDDGSSDDSASIAESEGALVFRHMKNLGKGASLREGFRRILEKDFNAVVLMDGDGQHEPGSIPDFIKAMDTTGADIVIGNRMLDTKAMPYVRKTTNRFMSYVISKMCGQRIPDTQCGYRLIKRKVLEEVKLDSANFEIESELLVRASRKSFRISSVPIKTIYRGEKSNINPMLDTLRFITFIARMNSEIKR